MSSSELLQTVTDSPSPLIQADQLKGLLDEPTVRIFDVRGTWSSPVRALREDYQAGNIPGASFLDWTKRFIDQDVPIGLAPVAGHAAAGQAFSDLGVSDGDLVVLYDDYHHMQAGRIWWAMRFWGFDNVRVLNGGWSHWVSRDIPVSQKTPQLPRGTFQPVRRDDLRISLEDFVNTHGQHCVIDARGPVNFAGKADDPRTGHIPNTLNIPFSALLNADTGLFLDSKAISEVFDARAPGWRETPIITSCGSGYAATVTLLALSELGYPARLFDGSFSVWKQDPARPVVQSELPS